MGRLPPAAAQAGRGPFGLVQVQRPASAPRALVLLLGEGRDTPRLAADAQALTAAGAVVGVVDASRYLARAGQDCAQYAVDLNWLGERVLRGAGVDDYIAPLLVGVGQGAQMARAALVHSRSPDVSAGVVERVAGAAPVACQAAAAPGLGESSRPRPMPWSPPASRVLPRRRHRSAACRWWRCRMRTRSGW